MTRPFFAAPGRSATTVVEFALTMPLFVVLISAIIELSWYFHERFVLREAVRAGCMEGARVHPDGLFQSTAQDAILAGLDGRLFRELPATLNITTSGETPYQVLHCDMIVSYSSLMGLVPVMDGLEMTAHTSVRFERQQ